jgi:cation diffusion facilitator CzcD-associated flavoprotein CzcO
MTETSVKVAVVGAGLAGLCAAIRLKQTGMRSFAVLEKAADVGGVWRDNEYPGAGCDIPSCLYSYSFARDETWPRTYAGQPGILAYIRRCSERHGVQPHIRFGAEVTQARFDENAGLWRLRTASGARYAARVLVTATGQLNRPRVPEFAGADDFTGAAFHSARWDHGHDLTGRSVAVIGNGCSAVQFVPRIAPVVRELTVFQRSPKWIIPKFDREHGRLDRLVDRVPGSGAARRATWFAMAETIAYSPVRRGVAGRGLAGLARLHLRHQIPDPALRAQLRPDFPFGCNRMILSNDYYPALMRPNVRLVTDPIVRLAEEGVVTADGRMHRADTLVHATGFHSTAFLSPIEVEGPGGRLHDLWRDGASAYLGITVPGFPNLFMLYGPNTSSANNSVIYMLESQVRYLLACLEVIGGRACSMEVTESAFAHQQRALEAELARTVFRYECSSWYRTGSGRVTNPYPGRAWRYRLATRRPDLAHYRLRDHGTRVSA